MVLGWRGLSTAARSEPVTVSYSTSEKPSETTVNWPVGPHLQGKAGPSLFPFQIPNGLTPWKHFPSIGNRLGCNETTAVLQKWPEGKSGSAIPQRGSMATREMLHLALAEGEKSGLQRSPRTNQASSSKGFGRKAIKASCRYLALETLKGLWCDCQLR